MPVVAVDVGGTHVSTAQVTAALEVRGERRFPLDADGTADDVLDSISTAVRIQLARPVRVAIAMPGPFDYERGIGDFTAVGKFGALSGVDVRTELAARVGVAPERIGFVNDAEAFGLGEWAAGSGRRVGRCVAVTLGTGIGSAFIDRGSCVRSGRDVPPGGDIHRVHVHGTPLEDHVSRRAFRRLYRQRSGQDADVAEVAARARSGETIARGLIVERMEVLGAALGPWVKSFGASTVVVGGSMTASADLFFPPLQDGLNQAMQREIRLATGVLPGQRASLMGAVLGLQTLPE